MPWKALLDSNNRLKAFFPGSQSRPELTALQTEGDGSRIVDYPNYDLPPDVQVGFEVLPAGAGVKPPVRTADETAADRIEQIHEWAVRQVHAPGHIAARHGDDAKHDAWIAFVAATVYRATVPVMKSNQATYVLAALGFEWAEFHDKASSHWTSYTAALKAGTAYYQPTRTGNTITPELLSPESPRELIGYRHNAADRARWNKLVAGTL